MENSGPSGTGTSIYCSKCGKVLPWAAWIGTNTPEFCECLKTPVDPIIKNVYYNYGWICPKCGAGLSPSTPVCPCSITYKITC